MRSSLFSFIEGLASLKDYIEELESQKKLLSYAIKTENPTWSESLILEFQEHSLKSLTKMKQYNYNSIIISLYGYLEQFIESLIRSYVNHLNNLTPNYKELPEKIAKNHIDLSFGLIKRVHHPRYKGSIKIEEVISNLNSCINSESRYKVNAEAFTYHEANFKSGVIQSTFAHIGVEGVSGRIIKCTSFKAYLSIKYPDQNLDKIKLSKAFFYLDDLAERRNEVAHGNISDDILSNEWLIEYIEFFEAYGPALYEVTMSEALQYDTKYRGIELGQPIKIYKNYIVCISIKNIPIPIKVGDILVAKTTNKLLPFIAGDIQEIQIDKIPYKEISSNTSADIAMKITFKAKQNQSFFLISKYHSGS